MPFANKLCQIVIQKIRDLTLKFGRCDERDQLLNAVEQVNERNALSNI